MPKIFRGEEVTIVGGGPSLEGFDFTRLRGAVIGTNHSMKFHSGVLHVSIDREFHEREAVFLNGLNCFKVTCHPTHRDDFIMAEVKSNHALKEADLDWNIEKCNLTGYFALAVAFELGACKVYLLGFDGGYPGDKKRNFHDYSFGSGMGRNNPMNEQFMYFKDYDIVNVGMDSLITVFKKVKIESDFYGLP